VVSEQQQWHKAQLSRIKAQEIAMGEAARRREFAFESSCFDHRQRMLAESELYVFVFVVLVLIVVVLVLLGRDCVSMIQSSRGETSRSCL